MLNSMMFLSGLLSFLHNNQGVGPDPNSYNVVSVTSEPQSHTDVTLIIFKCLSKILYNLLYYKNYHHMSVTGFNLIITMQAAFKLIQQGLCLNAQPGKVP